MHLFALHFTHPLQNSDFTRLLGWVSPERRARITRYQLWQDAHRALYAELLARFSIHQALAHPLDTIAFETTDKGKPFLPEVPDFHFNLSHSGDWVLCATHDAPIGVDVERIQPLIPDILTEVLTQEEREVYATLPKEQRQAFFYTLWTIKESYAKAMGFGLQLQFRDITVRLEAPEGIQIQRYGDVDRNIWVWPHALDPDHPVAICAFQEESPRPPLQVTCWEVEDFIQLYERALPRPCSIGVVT